MAQKMKKQGRVSRWTSLATSLLALLVFGCGGGGGGGGTQPPSKDLPDAVADAGGGADTVVTDTGGGEVSQGDVGGEVTQETKPGEEVTQTSKTPRMRLITGKLTGCNGKLALGAECRGKDKKGNVVRRKFLAAIDPQKHTFELTLPKGLECTMSYRCGANTKKVKFVRQQIQKPPQALKIGTNLGIQTLEVKEVTGYTIPEIVINANTGEINFSEDVIVVGDGPNEKSIWKFVDSDRDGTVDFDDPIDNKTGKYYWQESEWKLLDDWIGNADWVNFEADDLCDPSNSKYLCVPEPDERLDEKDCANSDYDYCYEEGEQGYEDFEGFCQAFPEYCECEEEQECGYDLLGNPCQQQCGQDEMCVFDYYCVPKDFCVPECDEDARCGDPATCGDYVCYGSCDEGEECLEKEDGSGLECRSCEPSCDYCGDDDGCGGICLEGQCENPNEQCEYGECVCHSSCEGKFCGDDDGCGWPCYGPCQDDGAVCIFTGEDFQCCTPECNGYCDGRDDTCGGQCFDCPEGYECSDGECV